MHHTLRPLLAPACLAVALAACSDDDPGGDTALDASADTALDASADIALDAGTDIAPDTADTADEDVAPRDPAEIAAELGAPGPYAIGYRTEQLTYTVPPTGTERTVKLVWWYPTETTDGEHPRYFNIWPDEDVVLNAPPIDGDDFPLVVYSHGTLGYAESSSFLMEHFASHGYVALAVEHTGDTTSAGGDTRTTEIYFQRSFDIRAGLDHALDPAAAHPFAGRISDRILGAAHSFGGYTMLTLAGATWAVDAIDAECDAGTGRQNVCGNWSDTYAEIFRDGFEDDRILGLFTMAQGDFRLFTAEGVATVDIPVLMVTGEEDPQRSGDAQPYWDVLGQVDGNGWLNLLNASHLAFTDACFLGVGFGVGCQDDDIDPELGFRIVNTHALAFARQVLFGDAEVAPLLDGTFVAGDGTAEWLE